MKKWILTALAVAGAAMCVLLANMTAPGTGEAVAANWCAPTEHMDCGYVLSSSYARIGVVSVAQLGIAYFAFLAAWFAIVGIPNHAGRAWRIVPLGITALGALASAWFVYVMAAKLPVWCPWCIAVHVVNGLIFILVLAIRPAHDVARGVTAESAKAAAAAAHPSASRALGVIGGAIAFTIMLFLFSYALFQQTAATINKNQVLDILTDVDYCEWDWRRQPQVDLNVRPDDPAIGPADAPMTAVAFIDFECPHCRELHHFALQMQTAFPNQVRFIFKHFPMNAACNPDQRSLHRYACEAAQAAEAARSAGSPEAATQYRGLLFENMSRLATRPYRDIAAKSGIPAEAFEKALAAKAGSERIAEDVALARRIGVTGSGKMFLDGRRLDHWVIPSRIASQRNDRPRTSELWQRLLGLAASMPATQAAPSEPGAPAEGRGDEE